MESRPLRYFVAVARTLSITRAAEALGMAQPPLSRHIKALEAEVGTLLFHRKNGLRLTEAGRAMLAKAEPALAMLDAAKESAAAVGHSVAATLPIGFVAVAGYSLLPRLTRAFKERHPEVDLRIECMTNSEQAQALKQDEIEVGIAWLPFDEPGYCITPLETDRMLVALPARHPLTRLQKLSREDLLGERLILGCRNAGIKRAIFHAMEGEAAGAAQPVREARDLAEAIDGVASGLGLTLVPSALRHERSGHVEYRELEKPETVVLGAVLRPRASTAAQQFVACAAQSRQTQGPEQTVAA
jgi:DNA-binding transcriptional LysR family regulator